MNAPYLTIAEAVSKTGRSPSTIRRLIRTITDAAVHEDRGGITPPPDEVEVLKKKGENFTWKIQEEILLKHLKGALKEEKKSVSEPKEDILRILERELQIKNQQIEKQWEVIHSLNDRLREGNILMGSLQKRLGPPQTESAQPSVEAVPVAVAKEATQKASKKPTVEETAKAAKQASKRGLFSWLKR